MDLINFIKSILFTLSLGLFWVKLIDFFEILFHTFFRIIIIEFIQRLWFNDWLIQLVRILYRLLRRSCFRRFYNLFKFLENFLSFKHFFKILMIIFFMLKFIFKFSSLSRNLFQNNIRLIFFIRYKCLIITFFWLFVFLHFRISIKFIFIEIIYMLWIILFGTYRQMLLLQLVRLLISLNFCLFHIFNFALTHLCIILILLLIILILYQRFLIILRWLFSLYFWFIQSLRLYCIFTLLIGMRTLLVNNRWIIKFIQYIIFLLLCHNNQKIK